MRVAVRVARAVERGVGLLRGRDALREHGAQQGVVAGSLQVRTVLGDGPPKPWEIRRSVVCTQTTAPAPTVGCDEHAQPRSQETAGHL